MYIAKTTAEERLTIGSAVGPIFTNIERAKNLLNDIWLNYFGQAKPENIDKSDTIMIGDLIYIVGDILHNAITEYCLTVGEDWYSGVDAYISGAETARSNIFVEKNRFKLPGNGSEIMSLTNEQAAVIIKDRLGEKVVTPDK